MTRAKKREDQPWLRFIVLPLLLLLFGLLISTLILPKAVIAPSTGEAIPTPTPTPTPTPPRFVCPTAAWVGCMPEPDRPRPYQCSAEFLNWAQTNCPGFEGAAY